MQKVLVSTMSFRPPPRGARWVGQATSWLLGLGDELRAAIAATAEAARRRAASVGDARARAELIALARRYQDAQPEFAKELFTAANHRRDD
jgi:hypothetical protein